LPKENKRPIGENSPNLVTLFTRKCFDSVQQHFGCNAITVKICILDGSRTFELMT
jgi:malate synthase